MAQPALTWHARPGDARAVALVLHGGAAQGREVNRPWSHNVARLVPFAWSLSWQVSGPLAVARLRFGVRGWNGAERSPVADAHWALERVRQRYPDRPVAVIGHSMGGRTALHIADEPGVDLVVGLAAWVESSDPLPQNGARTVFIHSDRDRITSIAGPRRSVEHLRRSGKEAALIRVAESDHAMLRRAGTWTALVTETVRAHFADELGVPWTPRPGPVGEVVASVVTEGESFVNI